MRIYQVALKEIRKRKIRTLYTSFGIAVAVSMLISVMITASSGQKEVFNVIARYGHSLTIVPVDTSSQQSLKTFGIGTGSYIPEKDLPDIEKVYQDAIIAGWEKMGALIFQEGTIGGGAFPPPTFAPRLYEETTVKGKEVIAGGVNLTKELVARFWWDIAEGRFMEHEDEAVIGRLFATVTGTKTGDMLDIGKSRFRVVGILNETDSPDDYMVFTTLKACQTTFGKQGKVSMINVRAMCPKCPVGEAAVEINKKILGVRATSQMEIATAQSQIFQKTTALIVSFVVASLIISCIGVFNIIMGSIHSRMREIGLLKALGASKGQLVRFFLYEAILIGITGGIIGFVLGSALSHVVGPILFKDIVIQISPRFLAIAVLLGTVATILASIYPALYASKIRVTEAFKSL
ncbi:MAG: FtsX-like permease family protein [Alphaproteobacteria bacterium]|uniref:FtsX-like permease family protein n=1 Tax=Candidatus Nitrobium versatile TaxID=2884831 RepID=A0A953J2J2_9BACT|nr:FtsX-like permease family protein [Candidatus Nitrobium versatile]